MKLFFHFSLFFTLILHCSTASAEVGINRVPQGATSKEVIVLLGAPKEQVERETKRQMVWYYPDGSIVFVKGRARSIYLNGSLSDVYVDQQEQKVQAAKLVKKAPPAPIEDILSEILREVPSDPVPDSLVSPDTRQLENPPK